MGRSFSLLLLFLPIPSSSPPPFSGALCWFPSPGCFSGSCSHRNRRCLFSHQHPDWQRGKDGSWLKNQLFGVLICVLGKWTDVPIQTIHIQQSADPFSWNNNDNYNEQGCSKMVLLPCSNRRFSPPARREPRWHSIIIWLQWSQGVWLRTLISLSFPFQSIFEPFGEAAQLNARAFL